MREESYPKTAKLAIPFLLILICPPFSGCGKAQGSKNGLMHSSQIPVPARPGSGEPNLFSGEDGQLYLSWIEPAGTGRALRFSSLSQEAWSPPRTVAQGHNWFVNWADFPSLVAGKHRRLAAHWLVRSGAGHYAYDINISQSFDAGRSWSRAVVPHRDGTETEHGFVSLLPWPDGRLFAAWLDGRDFASPSNDHSRDNGAEPEMALRAAFLDEAGTVHHEQVLDRRTCECCQTSAALTEAGAIVAYRDRSGSEVRDISVVRMVDGKWRPPAVLYPDGWKIDGCPVNGPAVAAEGARVAIAWFTAAADTPRVKVVFSEDSGATFSSPVVANDGETIGRVDVCLLPDGSAFVAWMESTRTAGMVLARRIFASGRKSDVLVLGQTTASRASGFPQVASLGERVVVAWTETGEKAKVRTAVIAMSNVR
ncbi:MAG: sialidase family protein [bacterium]